MKPVTNSNEKKLFFYRSVFMLSFVHNIGIFYSNSMEGRPRYFTGYNHVAGCSYICIDLMFPVHDTGV